MTAAVKERDHDTYAHDDHYGYTLDASRFHASNATLILDYIPCTSFC
jgi:hypothetical protein